ncbi:hypothetical protein PM082_004082 [Marasmius tenuissimus]|nr:hypothetical protein PM082_004082 [Marasmius tenuissimus]
MSALGESGVMVELECLDDKTSTILNRLGKLLSGAESGLGRFVIWSNHETPGEMPAVHTILSIVEKHVDERCLTKEVIQAAPWLRSAMMTAAYRTPRRPPSESELRMKERANEILRKLNILELGAGG